MLGSGGAPWASGLSRFLSAFAIVSTLLFRLFPWPQALWFGCRFVLIFVLPFDETESIEPIRALEKVTYNQQVPKAKIHQTTSNPNTPTKNENPTNRNPNACESYNPNTTKNLNPNKNNILNPRRRNLLGLRTFQSHLNLLRTRFPSITPMVWGN